MLQKQITSEIARDIPSFYGEKCHLIVSHEMLGIISKISAINQRNILFQDITRRTIILCMPTFEMTPLCTYIFEIFLL